MNLPYQLVFAKGFYDSLDRLDSPVKARLPKIFGKLKENPRFGKPLHGKWGYYRARFLNYRLLYTINEKEQTVVVLEVGKRESVYK